MKSWTNSKLFAAFRRGSQSTDGERLLDSPSFQESSSWSPSDVYTTPKVPRRARKPSTSASHGAYVKLSDSNSAEVPTFPPPPTRPFAEARESVDLNGQPPYTQPKPSAISFLLHPATIFINKHKLILTCSLPLIAVLLEIPMLCFFLYSYLRLPINPSTSLRPRLSPLYSIWPFISCVGSIRLDFYRGVSIIGSLLIVTASFISLYWARDVHPGYYLRRITFLSTLVASGLLIALVFAAEHVSSDVHLVFVALRMVFLYSIKSTTWLTWRMMRNTYPGLVQDYANGASYFWKIGFMSLAFPLAFLANIGVWSCRNPEWIQTKGTMCYNLIAAAAISDWLYAVVNVVFLVNLAYDIWHADHFGRAREGEVLAARAFKTGHWKLRHKNVV